MENYLGPIINKTKSRFSTRYSLGIEGVAVSMAGVLCNIVNTVTPKPYYWAFFAWCYYDLYSHSEPSERTRSRVNEYIRKTNYYIALGNILANGHGVGGFVGQETIFNNTTLSNAFFNYSNHMQYLKGLSTMGYYSPGLDNMKLVVSENSDTGDTYKEPVITQEGEKLALAFDKVISTTQYYQKYRMSNNDVPRDVLIELGQIISYDLDGFDDCKAILIRNLFERNRTERLRNCKDYVSFVDTKYHYALSSPKNCRYVLYDMFSVRGEHKELDETLRSVADKWEVVMGRQYFVNGMEIIWKYMMSKLSRPMTMKEWIEYCISEQVFSSFDITDEIYSVCDEYDFSFQEREAIIDKERRRSDEHSLENGLKILFSVYKRFKNRDDFEVSTQRFFLYGKDNDSICMEDFFKLLEENKYESIGFLLRYIMENYLIKQHMNTSFEKKLRGVDGYFLEEIEGKYVLKEHYSFDYQGNRLAQVYSVMKDLGMIENADS